MANYQDSYQIRISSYNNAQEEFELYLKNRGSKYTHIGIDHHFIVKNFYKLPKSIRCLPDYMVEGNNGTPIVCEVKGTTRIKINDLTKAMLFQDECEMAGSCFHFVFILNKKIYSIKPKDLFQKIVGKTIQVYDDSSEPHVQVTLSDLHYFDEIQSVSVV